MIKKTLLAKIPPHVIFQQLGCTSKFSLDLAQGLVKDYFVLIPKAVSGLQDLPQLAPQFTANFLTAVAEMYGVAGEFPGISIAQTVSYFSRHQRA